MAGLLEWYGGDNTAKDDVGMTEADRRQPVFDNLIKAGLLAYAGGGRVDPNVRAQMYAQAGGAIGDITSDQIRQRTAMSQQALARQRIAGQKAELEQATKWRDYADSPEFKKALDEGRATPAERMAAKAAALKGDFSTVQKILDPAKHRVQVKDGNYVYPNGDIFNPIYGWVVKDNKPTDFMNTGAGGAPQQGGAPQGGAPPAPGGGAPQQGGVTSVTVQATPPPGNIDQEITQWSATPRTAGLPEGVQPSEFAEDRNYEVLGRLPMAARAQVQAIGDYREPAGSVHQKMRDPLMLALVRQYNPGFQENNYGFLNKQREEYSAKGATGRSMIAQNTAYAHIGSLWDQYKELAGPDTPVARETLQRVQTQLGLPSTAGFDVAKLAVADEVAKSMRNSGALNQTEQEHWQARFKAAQSPAQFQKAIEEAFTLMEGKEGALKDKFRTDTRLELRPFLSPENRKKADDIRKNPLTNKSANPPAAKTGTARPQIGWTPDRKPIYQGPNGPETDD